MAESAVVAVVNYEGRVMLGKKHSDSRKFLAGEWHVPGETVRDGESDEDALHRGVREEAGILIEVGRYIGEHTTPTGRQARWYECFAHTDRVSVGEELEAIKWVPKESVLVACGERVNSFWSEEIKIYFHD